MRRVGTKVAKGKLTYAYCLVSAKRRPSVAGLPAGLPGLRTPRILRAGSSLWLVVADAPLARYGAEAIDRGLRNLSWLSKCAIAHEGVIERFMKADACIPMKLFTLFASDERALASTHEKRRALGRILRQVKRRAEWGVRILCDRPPSAAQPRRQKAPRRVSGAAYLSRKRELRQSAREFRAVARERAEEVFEILARQAHRAERLAPAEAQASGSSLLLDAAYLVRRSGESAFRTCVQATARRLLPPGCRLTLSGPWPPYNFV